MDIATIVGIVLGFGLVVGSILLGGPLLAFVNAPGLLIVLGGTIAATLISEKLSVFIGSTKVALKAFLQPSIAVNETIERLVHLATIMRKDGLLALENEKIDDSFLAKGVRMAMDGVAPESVRSALVGEMQALRDRHRKGQRLFRFMGATAPAMGMVGTLIGLVQMLQTMSDPSSIGPSMAVALLTTLYGAILAFLIFNPIADKLEGRTKDEVRNMTVIVAGIESVLNKENPRIIRERLEAFVDPVHRSSQAEETQAA
ncbi:MAG: MotA/TolQ/ExbB proton channel family protein [Acidobacteriota bacterium]|nr:MotA/TolQ/ExbB proton channel family protein [Acidobacteriota bacterium]